MALSEMRILIDNSVSYEVWLLNNGQSDMKTFNNVLRILMISFLIVLAASGAGIVGAFLPNNRERYMDKEITTEQVDKKRDKEGQEKEDRN